MITFQNHSSSHKSSSSIYFCLLLLLVVVVLQIVVLQITVCGDVVKESECKKILGILANNKLSWWHHLNGDKSDPKKPKPGLIGQLSKRVGLLCQLVKLVPKEKFKVLVD